jgi:aspartate racemase
LKKAKFFKPIGIVGGAGPMASAFLYNTLIDVCQKEYDSNDYNEFPEIILESYPFIRGDREKIQQDISLCIKKLKSAGAELFCVASNSFHGFLPDVSWINFVHLISEGLKEASRCNVSNALILAAETTINLKLYEQSRLHCIYPSQEDQKQIQKIIREVAGGMLKENQSAKLKEIINFNRDQSQVDGVIIACTELPLIHRKFPLLELNGLPIIDTVEVLARKLLILSQERGRQPRDLD